MAFKPRTITPTTRDKQYVSQNRGGYSYGAIVINKSTGFILPNCVGYAWGRAWEILGGKYPNIAPKNAYQWYWQSHGYTRSQTPRVGAIAVWNRSYGQNYGHVAIVEKVWNNGRTMQTSESSYPTRARPAGVVFEEITRSYPFGTAYLPFMGFIYLPVEGAVDPGGGGGGGGTPGGGGTIPGGPGATIGSKEGDDNFLLLHGNFY